MRPLLVALLARVATAQDIDINRIENPGVILYKTSGPLPEARLGDDFPGSFPARFMRQAWGLEGPRSPEGASLVNNLGRHRHGLDVQRCKVLQPTNWRLEGRQGQEHGLHVQRCLGL